VSADIIWPLQRCSFSLQTKPTLSIFTWGGFAGVPKRGSLWRCWVGELRLKARGLINTSSFAPGTVEAEGQAFDDA